MNIQQEKIDKILETEKLLLAKILTPLKEYDVKELKVKYAIYSNIIYTLGLRKH